MTYANYLELFNYILTHGEKRGDKTQLNNLTVWHDIDGYTCYLAYEGVILTLLFHSRFSFEYEEKSSFNKFENETLKVFTSIQQKRVNNKS